jgi:hypothetical protein
MVCRIWEMAPATTLQPSQMSFTEVNEGNEGVLLRARRLGRSFIPIERGLNVDVGL